jgi:hypothetical protein
MTCPKIFKNQSEKDVAIWCAQRMGYYDIKWSTDGEIAVRDADNVLREMSPNHLKSIIRRDYIEQQGPYPALSKIIQDIINYACNIAKISTQDLTQEQLCGKLSA